MPGSPFFARIKAQVLQLTAAVLPGRVCTHQSMGEHLDVMPRHVAYILSQLADHEKMVYPWHRVVSADGSLGAAKLNPDGTPQAELLRQEGLLVSGNRLASSMALVFVPAAQLPSGLPPQTRPADAPVAPRARPRAASAAARRR